ncbi:MAG: DinB family protein [Ignavibacteria bacterium]
MLSTNLQELSVQFSNIKAQADNLLRGLTPEQFNKRPSENSWSVSECLEHLNITGKDYTKVIDSEINKGLEQNIRSDDEPKFSFIGKMFIKAIEPPVKMKFKTTGQWMPAPNLNIDKIKSDFISLQDRFLELLSKAQGLNLTKLKVYSPATKLLGMNLLEAFNLNSAHERRHLLQAGNAKNKILNQS